MTVTLSPGPEAVAVKSSSSVVVSSVDNTSRPLNADGAAISVRSPFVSTPGVTSTSTVPVVKLEADTVYVDEPNRCSGALQTPLSSVVVVTLTNVGATSLASVAGMKPEMTSADTEAPAITRGASSKRYEIVPVAGSRVSPAVPVRAIVTSRVSPIATPVSR